MAKYLNLFESVEKANQAGQNGLLAPHIDVVKNKWKVNFVSTTTSAFTAEFDDNGKIINVKPKTDLVYSFPLNNPSSGTIEEITGINCITGATCSCTWDSQRNAYRINPSTYANNPGDYQVSSGLRFDNIDTSLFTDNKMTVIFDVYSYRILKYSSFSNGVRVNFSPITTATRGTVGAIYLNIWDFSVSSRLGGDMPTYEWITFKIVIDGNVAYFYKNGSKYFTYNLQKDDNWEAFKEERYRSLHIGLQGDGRNGYYSDACFRNFKVYNTIIEDDN